MLESKKYIFKKNLKITFHEVTDDISKTPTEQINRVALLKHLLLSEMSKFTESTRPSTILLSCGTW